MIKVLRYVLVGALFVACLGIMFVGPAMASTGADGSSDSGHGLGALLYALVIILLAAKLGGHVMERFGQPAVLGELIFGVILGNLILLGVPWFEFVKGQEAIVVMAEIGVILLLFEVGLRRCFQCDWGNCQQPAFLRSAGGPPAQLRDGDGIHPSF